MPVHHSGQITLHATHENDHASISEPPALPPFPFRIKRTLKISHKLEPDRARILPKHPMCLLTKWAVAYLHVVVVVIGAPDCVCLPARDPRGSYAEMYVLQPPAAARCTAGR